MNTIEALRILHDIADVPVRLSFNPATFEAHKVIGDLLAAYDALVPPPDLWPSDAQWFTVDDYGAGEWHASEPFPDDGEWRASLGESHYCGTYLLPDVDWRLCKWPRPQDERLQSEPPSAHWIVSSPPPPQTRLVDSDTVSPPLKQ